MASCAELSAFRTATESLSDMINRSPRLGRAMFFRNLVPRGTYVKGEGVTRSTFNIKSTEPTDDNTQFSAITLSSGQPTPSCSITYEDIGVGFFERTYGPKKRNFRGPVLCREIFQFQHNIGAFINAYVDEIGMYVARAWEFALRSDMITFADWFVDGTKTVGPSAVSTAGRAYQGLTQDLLDDVAVDLMNTGAGVPDGRGYVEDGPSGPIFPLYIDARDSARIFKANSTIRDDFRYASEGMDGTGDYSLWRAIGASRVIGNFRHVPTFIAPRFNFTGGVYVPVTPFKTISAVGTDQVVLTDAYNNAAFAGALVAMPSTMTAEVVAPEYAGLAFDPKGYNGDFRFITGGYRICDTPEYDPEGNKGRHFAELFYAARPDRIHDSKFLVYKRCASTRDAIYCS